MREYIPTVRKVQCRPFSTGAPDVHGTTRSSCDGRAPLTGPYSAPWPGSNCHSPSGGAPQPLGLTLQLFYSSTVSGEKRKESFGHAATSCKTKQTPQQRDQSHILNHESPSSLARRNRMEHEMSALKTRSPRSLSHVPERKASPHGEVTATRAQSSEPMLQLQPPPLDAGTESSALLTAAFATEEVAESSK